jgi:hypothetical protein
VSAGGTLPRTTSVIVVQPPGGLPGTEVQSEAELKMFGSSADGEYPPSPPMITPMAFMMFWYSSARPNSA